MAVVRACNCIHVQLAHVLPNVVDEHIAEQVVALSGKVRVVCELQRRSFGGSSSKTSSLVAGDVFCYEGS